MPSTGVILSRHVSAWRKSPRFLRIAFSEPDGTDLAIECAELPARDITNSATVRGDDCPMAIKAKSKTKKPAAVKNLAPSDAKRVKGGLLPAVQVQQADGSVNIANIGAIASKYQKV